MDRLIKIGDLSLTYADGFIRYLRLGQLEVLRMINHLVRDKNWNTVPQEISDEEIKTIGDTFTITYKCRAKDHEVDFIWQCYIEGTVDNKITFSINGKALKPFKRNRVGFTVLHPNRECRGQPVTIWHSDGSSESSVFPKLISPHQPFMDIKAMEWWVGEGRARLEFSGEVFETEDQRNWTDDSYKTYCTPLSLPFPHTLEAGDTVSQKIELSITVEKPASIPGDNSQLYSFAVLPQVHQLPRIGVGRSSETHNLTENQVGLLKSAKFDHYQVDLRLFETQWKTTFEKAVDEATRLDIGLELSLFFKSVEQEYGTFLELASGFTEDVRIINIFDYQSPATSEDTLNSTVNRLKQVFAKASVGAGTNAFFTELNRNRVDYEALDHLVYSINPQVHAFDNQSLVESLYAQPDTVDTARSFSKGRSVHISPVTLKMRWNPNATEADDSQLDSSDPRQMSLFGAGWVLGSMQNLMATDLEAVTYFETVGNKGIMQDEQLFPMYYVFEFLLKRKAQEFRAISSSDPLTLGGLLVGQQELVLVNFTNREIEVALPYSWQNCKTRFMDLNNVWKLMTQETGLDQLPTSQTEGSLILTPFALAFLNQ